jgi:ABC-2 type transport system permease protein
LALWALGLAAGAALCAANIASGFGQEAQRIASLEVAIDSPALLIGRGLPMGASQGAFLFYTYGVVLATVFALFATLFAVRHGRAEEDDGARELLRAAATGRLSSLVAMFATGATATVGLAAAMAIGLIAGGADPAGSLWAGVTCALVGLVFLATGALTGQLAPTARAATGLGAGIIAAFFVVRVIADVTAEIDPDTLIGTPSPLGWLSPFSLALITDPYGAVNPLPLFALAAASGVGAAAAVAVERRREFGASIMRPRPGPARAPATLRTPLRLTLRLQRGTLVAMMLAGVVVGAFAAVLAALALSGDDQNEAIGDTIRALVGADGPLYDLLLSYVMVLVGECAAVAGALAILRARREEAGGNVEMVRGAPTGPGRWFVSVLAVGAVSIALVLATAWIGATAVYLAEGMSGQAVLEALAATVANLPAAVLYLGVIALVFAALPRLTGAIAWTILALGVVLTELGGRLGLPNWAIKVSPFTHTPLVTTEDPNWGGAIWMSAAAVTTTVVALAVYRRRDLSP